MSAFVPVPRLWPNATVVCAGSGPSLTAADLKFCRGAGRLIVVNDAYTLAPWADCLYAADDKWWKWHKGVPGFAGMKYTIKPTRKPWPDLHTMKNTGHEGIETAPDGLRTGFNSGYQAIGMAVHFGASRIVLLGYDMRGDHFFGSHRDKSRPPFAASIAAFQSAVEPLAKLGVAIVNCTPGSAIKAFDRAALHEVFPVEMREAV
jgi:hypothetical protein